MAVMMVMKHMTIVTPIKKPSCHAAQSSYKKKKHVDCIEEDEEKEGIS